MTKIKYSFVYITQNISQMSSKHIEEKKKEREILKYTKEFFSPKIRIPLELNKTAVIFVF